MSIGIKKIEEVKKEVKAGVKEEKRRKVEAVVIVIVIVVVESVEVKGEEINQKVLIVVAIKKKNLKREKMMQ